MVPTQHAHAASSLVSLKGPVPEGVSVKAFQSRPTFSHWVGLDIMIYVSR